jgi:hypothetical protein
MKQLTVSELIAELQKQPQDANVIAEGCDCYGRVVSVTLDEDGVVCIERDNEDVDSFK